MAEKLTPKPARPFEGVADPDYLLSEIEQLRDIAREAGLGTLEYLLECARSRRGRSSPQKVAGITVRQVSAATGRHQHALPRAKLCRPTAHLPSLAYS